MRSSFVPHRRTSATAWAEASRAGHTIVVAPTGAAGANLKQWNYDGSANLQWQLVDLGGGW
ncbi:hypothetical protein [Streptosporangium amethystogenes]|uniref:hypothetical protein n=1 Tax=Streptosporangium amethystogenes TaxID=2002 RepID=UPI0004C7EF62|nr:hypothetical protein [Streptosporangium amethystogenes]